MNPLILVHISWRDFDLVLWWQIEVTDVSWIPFPYVITVSPQKKEVQFSFPILTSFAFNCFFSVTATFRHSWCCAAVCEVRLPSLRAPFWRLASITSLQVTVCFWCSSAITFEFFRSKNAIEVVILKQFILLQILDVKKRPLSGNHCTVYSQTVLYHEV